MPDPFAALVHYLIDPGRDASSDALDVGRWLTTQDDADGEPAPGDGPATLTAAFLVALAGPEHPLRRQAMAVLHAPPADAPTDLIAVFRHGLEAIPREIEEWRANDPAFARVLTEAAEVAADQGTAQLAATEAIWSVLYPEAVGLSGSIDDAVAGLRRRRMVQVDQPNPRPIADAGREILFTSNVLVGLPLDAAAVARADRDPGIADAVARARLAPQRYWFDHPIPIGVDPAANELLHGLQGLDAAVRAELAVGDGGPGARPRATRLTCLLSVSVTHAELRGIARRYVELALAEGDMLEHVDVLVVSETDARQLLSEVLVPAASRLAAATGRPPITPADLDVLGVDGEYARHYSFLKAIAAIWHVLIDPGVRGTFKIDLDQVFPQAELVAQTGQTAFQHFETPLWGAMGRDADGRPIELGMIAGGLVNAGDIERGLFTPDVPIPGGPRRASDHVFFSPLPQAISTRAEMMERYDGASPDGVATAIERIHVTGGTNGILVDALRRHRPFTPSFIGRAEDQAYALSVQGQAGSRLAYVHAAGLIMRHDKDQYAGAAIEAAQVGKLVGDDVRILTFSAYAGAIAGQRSAAGVTVAALKSRMDPFTGGFISRLPLTVVLLRFALRILEAYGTGQRDLGHSYATIGSRRLTETLWSAGEEETFDARIAGERAQWATLYDTLDALEAALGADDAEALELQRRARELVDGWRVRPTPIR